MLIVLAASLAALALFSVLLYGAPIVAALAPIVGSAVMFVVLLGHLWARERRANRGFGG